MELVNKNLEYPGATSTIGKNLLAVGEDNAKQR